MRRAALLPAIAVFVLAAGAAVAPRSAAQTGQERQVVFEMFGRDT
jgi:hypothetical protein